MTLWHLVALLTGLAVGVAVALTYRRLRDRRADLTNGGRRILFPFAGVGLSRPALDAALRLAQAEGATLVPAYLAVVPMHLPLTAPLPAQCDAALPLLETIEQLATRHGVAVDSRIERGRDPRHAFRRLVEDVRYDRIVVAADADGGNGFTAADVAWMLDHAPGEMIVVRPGGAAPLEEATRTRAGARSPAPRPSARARARAARSRRAAARS